MQRSLHETRITEVYYKTVDDFLDDIKDGLEDNYLRFIDGCLFDTRTKSYITPLFEDLDKVKYMAELDGKR